MKNKCTPEEFRTKAIMSAAYLDGEVFDIQNGPLVYCLIAKYGKTNKAFFRFFAVVAERIEDITRYVHYVTGYPMRDCKQYFAIYTHSTNAEDIIRSLSEKLYASGVIQMEKL